MFNFKRVFSQDQIITQLQDNIKDLANQLFTPFSKGEIIEVALKPGINKLEHRLGRKPNGYIIVDQQAASDIYRSADFDQFYLTLTASAAVNVKIFVF